MTECAWCGHPSFRLEHADWCADIGAWIHELDKSDEEAA